MNAMYEVWSQFVCTYGEFHLSNFLISSVAKRCRWKSHNSCEIFSFQINALKLVIVVKFKIWGIHASSYLLFCYSGYILEPHEFGER